jgi:orotidine-5'-phosphate decarboxylase
MGSMMSSRIILSLDFAGANETLELVNKIDPGLCRVKVGKELFTRSGPRIVEQLIRNGFDVFLDLKFHDIPTTVARACTAAADMGVWMVNVHASGGTRMMHEARDAIDKNSHKPLLIAVTVLTSMTDEDLKQVGIMQPAVEQVMALATLANSCGLDGVVCSAHEASVIKNKIGSEFKLVTPGIRPGGSDKNDQSRVMTPTAAIKAGSDYLVIGRPITHAPDPLQALIAIDEEIKSVKREA